VKEGRKCVMPKRAFPYSVPAKGLREPSIVLTDGTVWNEDDNVPDGYTVEDSEWEILNVRGASRDNTGPSRPKAAG
jgi:hypothetical protein